MTIDCTPLSTISSFVDYVNKLQNLFANDFSIANMLPCRSEICSVLYGVGNADVSGIGVIVGYFMELYLGLLLATGVIFSQRVVAKRNVPCAIHQAFKVYADAAILLTFSIQLASTIIQIKKDFGITSNDFGGLTVEVTWATALLTMLPMLLLCCIGADLERPELRLILICSSWLLFFYTFISRMIARFGPSQIGSSSGGSPANITRAQIANISMLCYSGESDLSQEETLAFDIFTIAGSLFVALVLSSVLTLMYLDRRRPETLRKVQESRPGRLMEKRGAKLLLIFNVFVWGTPQLWAILRLRSIQQALADSIQVSDQDSSWSFGQIVAVVIFLPVVLEFIYVFMYGPPEFEEEEAEQEKSTVDVGTNKSIGVDDVVGTA